MACSYPPTLNFRLQMVFKLADGYPPTLFRWAHKKSQTEHNVCPPLHQVPHAAGGAMKTWVAHNPGLTMHLHNDEEAERLVNESFGADTLQVRGQGYRGREDGKGGISGLERDTSAQG